MKISYLPEDVTVDILSRLPVKALLRFKCVCTHWRTLISSTFFASLHLRRSVSNPPRHSILVHNSYFAPITSFDPVALAPVEKSNLGLNQMTFGPLIICVGSINGLICITGLSYSWIGIWNPSTRVAKELQPVIKTPRKYSLGFGWDPTVNDYKVVRLCCSNGREKFRNWVEVWSANLQSWREIKVERNFCVQRLVCDVILEGFTHWIVKDGIGRDSKPLVASFDMRTEVLRLVPVPELLLGMVPLPALLNVQKLLLGQHSPFFGMNWKETFALVGCVSIEPKKIYQVWTMENDTVGKEFWSKKFTFELDFEFGCFVSSVNGILVLIGRPGEVILYDVETRETKMVENQEHKTCVLGAHYYVESLLSIKKGFTWASLLYDNELTLNQGV